MSNTDIAELRDSTVDSASPGQTFLNFFGEGGRDDSAVAEDGRELCQERESFEHWWVVSRPPANDTFGAGEVTEYVMHRLGGNDVLTSASMNREIAAQVRTLLGADLEPGEIVLFTGNGTATAYVRVEPDGTLTQSIDDGGGNTVEVVLDPSTGHMDMTTSGKVRIGGVSADTPLVRYAELMALWGSLKTEYDAHGHMYLPGPGGAVFSQGPGLALAPSAPPTSCPAWDPNIASASGETD